MVRATPPERLLSLPPEPPEPIVEPRGRIRLERTRARDGAPRWRIFVDGRPADG